MWITEEPVIRYFVCPTCDGFPFEDDADPDFAQAVFDKYRIKYVVVHRLSAHGAHHVYETEEALLAIETYLGTVVGMVPVYQDAKLTVYRNYQLETERVLRPIEQTAQ